MARKTMAMDVGGFREPRQFKHYEFKIINCKMLISSLRCEPKKQSAEDHWMLSYNILVKNNWFGILPIVDRFT